MGLWGPELEIHDGDGPGASVPVGRGRLREPRAPAMPVMCCCRQKKPGTYVWPCLRRIVSQLAVLGAWLWCQQDCFRAEVFPCRRKDVGCCRPGHACLRFRTGPVSGRVLRPRFEVNLIHEEHFSEPPLHLPVIHLTLNDMKTSTSEA